MKFLSYVVLNRPHAMGIVFLVLDSLSGLNGYSSG